MNELDLISAANDGFRKWFTLPETQDFVETERLRIGKAPTLYMVAFNTRQGYVKLDASVVKMTKLVDEAGRFTDLELCLVNDQITDPLMITASAFQPGAHERIQFCRIFGEEKYRDRYYDDIRYMTELTDDYKRSTIEFMRRQMGGFGL
jgi:hypothetical protein